MLTRLIKTQLVLFTAVAVAAVVVLGWYFLRIPSQICTRACSRCSDR